MKLLLVYNPHAAYKWALKWLPQIEAAFIKCGVEVNTYQAKNINIESDSIKVLTPDGELVGLTPAEIKCLPGAVRVFWK